MKSKVPERDKVMQKIKLRNLLKSEKMVEVEALVDTGATGLVLPEDLVRKLELEKVKDVRVRYADGRVEKRTIYRAVVVEIFGREGTFDVICEKEGATPLLGQVVLEMLDLVVDTKSRKLIPNPASPDTPLLEIL